jgi:hypothetical protein
MAMTMTTKASFIRTVNEMIYKRGFKVCETDEETSDYDEFVKDGFNYTVIKTARIGEEPCYSIKRVIFPYKYNDESIYVNGVYAESSMIRKKKNDKLKHSYYSIEVKRQTSCKLCQMVNGNCGYSSYFRLRPHNKTKKHDNARSVCASIITDTTKLGIDNANEIMSYL